MVGDLVWVWECPFWVGWLRWVLFCCDMSRLETGEYTVYLIYLMDNNVYPALLSSVIIAAEKCLISESPTIGA
jgi:hypothetical protein